MSFKAVDGETIFRSLKSKNVCHWGLAMQLTGKENYYKSLKRYFGYDMKRHKKFINAKKEYGNCPFLRPEIS